MPWGDGTGPWWAKSNDNGWNARGRGRRGWFGFGRGRGYGYGRFYTPENDYYNQSQEDLKREIDWLTERINFLKSRLKKD